MDTIEELAWNWLEVNWKISRSEMQNLVCFPHTSMNHRVVEFYDSETGEVFHEWFITSPMLEQLLASKNPKKVRNEFRSKERVV